jgi:hypothetical protein
VVHESTGREHLEDLCNKSNNAKFKQTEETPFTTGALQEDVVWVGIGPAVCMILDGTYEPLDEVDESTKKMIKQFQQNRKVTEHEPLYKITPEEWKSFGKEQQSERPVGVTYCILEHGKKDPSVTPLRN